MAYAVALVLLPALLGLAALEALLRAAGFGHATGPLVQSRQADGTYWVGNPDFTRLWFPARLKRLPPSNRVPVEKGASTRRYMVVGGSAAAGDPDPDFSIARNLEWLLSAVHPEIDWQVLNLAYTACNSHVAREVVRRSGPYALDGVIVLVGNNEVIGPFGPGTTLTEALPSAARRAWQVRLRRTRLGQLGKALRERMEAGAEAGAWRGMQQFLEHRIAADDPRLRQVRDNFRRNLEDIERCARRRGIPALLANVPVNLLDQPPFHDDPANLPEPLRAPVLSWLETGTSTLPLDELLAALADPPAPDNQQPTTDTPSANSAYAHYMAGALLFEAGERGRAEAHLRRAVDLDQLRFRADSALNAIIRAQWQRPGTAWVPVDAEAALIADHPRGALGFPHFYEHVHFTLRANFLIARAMARALLAHEGLDTARLEQLTWGDAAAGLGYTEHEAWKILGEILDRLGQPPFDAIPGHARRTEWMRVLHRRLEATVSRAEEKARMHAAYLAAGEARPGDDRLRLNRAHFLAANGHDEAAHAILAGLFPRHPTDAELAVAFLEVSSRVGRRADAQAALRRLERIYPEHPALPRLRGLAGQTQNSR